MDRSRRHRIVGGASIASLLLSCIVAPVAAHAWGDGGHMMVAEIAWGRLTPHAKSAVNGLLLSPTSPASFNPINRVFNGEDANDPENIFVHAAHWADDVKHTPAFSATADEHFIDIPFTTDHTTLPTDLPKAVNITAALKKCVATLKGSAPDSQKAAALRFLIHYVGDIHQPLHCATRVTAHEKEGDVGGNGFTVTLVSSHTTLNLHSLWDEGLKTFPPTGASFNPPKFSQVKTAATTIQSANPFSATLVASSKSGYPFDFSDWATESSNIAQTFVYTNLTLTSEHAGKASATYIATGAKKASTRIAQAGYRLADVLNTLFP